MPVDLQAYQQPNENNYQPQYAQYPPQQYQQNNYQPQSVYAQPQVVYTEAQPIYTVDAQSAKDEDAARMMFYIGFIVGIMWIINYLMHRKSTSVEAQKYARWSAIAGMVKLAFIAVFVALFVMVIILQVVTVLH